jgi:hypothetical protein
MKISLSMHSKHSGNKQQEGNIHDLTRTQLQPHKLEVVDRQEDFLNFLDFFIFHQPVNAI